MRQPTASTRVHSGKHITVGSVHVCVLIVVEAINAVADMVSSTNVITNFMYLMVVWAGWRAFAVTSAGARGLRIL